MERPPGLHLLVLRGPQTHMWSLARAGDCWYGAGTTSGQPTGTYANTTVCMFLRFRLDWYLDVILATV